ncbi:MAG: DUF1553 domain-containing protein [Planctomycetales bacterium]|nr:DUF1553 domain-containing protein [Planctomycetales bacterium]
MQKIVAIIMISFGPLSMALGQSSSIEFNRDIRPILTENCFACHGPDSAARKADLRLDQREFAVEAGAVDPGNVDGSTLIERIVTDDTELLMPPPETKKKLSAAQIQLLHQWVASGAEYQPHWSLIPPQRAQPPVYAGSDHFQVRNPIDQYVGYQLSQMGLDPAGPADARTLFRRLHLDITGLPPNPRDVAQFEREYKDGDDGVLSHWIDRLMDSPQWGEHRARYWLDAARYADTHGYHFDNYREIFPYRDWVIRAFNRNQPFDEFVVEQLAGDLLEHPTDEQLVATGFQRCNMTTNEGGTIDEENMAIYAADRVQTFGWVFLGMTTNCGQCHNHKFDPFSMQDYYSLAAFFRNTTQPPKDGNSKDGKSAILVVPSPEDRQRWDSLPSEIEKAKVSISDRRVAAVTDFEAWRSTLDPDQLKKDIPNQSLVVHCPLTEGSGNQVADLACQDRTVEATGEISWAADGKLGAAPVVKLGASYSLGASGNFEKDQAFSYGAWVRPSSDTASGGIIARMDEKNDYRGWDLWQQGKTIAVHIIDHWSDNALKVVTQKDALEQGKWTHVFVTYDGSSKPEGVRIYINGQLRPHKTETNSLKSDATIRTATPLRIGQRSDQQAFQDGQVQDVRIYERALDADEVKRIADSASLVALLSIAPEKYTDKQQAALFEHYLSTHDAAFGECTNQLADLEKESAEIRARSPITHIQQEKKDTQPMTNILIRGEYDRLGDEVTATTPAALHPMSENSPRNRLGLAQWLFDEQNPLTARVTVNRFWQQVFGRGLVYTAEDFGVTGSPPSHPELLDWLAIEFRDSGWDVRHMFKLMLMSSTYRQSATCTAEKLEKDPLNIFLSRGPRFRMDGEMVRDYALCASGLLNEEMFGPGVRPYQPDDIWNVVGLPGGDTRNYVQDKGDKLYRRTLYSFWKRMAPPPNMEAFNAPSREVCTVRRERTNTPLQALVTLNDPQFVEAARHLAESAMKLSADKGDVRVANAISLRVLARRWKAEERKLIVGMYREYLNYFTSQPEAAGQLVSLGETPRDMELPVDQLAAWTLVTNQVLNLDEALTK